MFTEKQGLTFISYSRADKDFALQLAKELKSSGFRIWLDQLDIPTGSRWDDEVENALQNCDIFMIILTPNSSASTNVKDEIGYAIDTNKHILPVLLKNATVPLRLRRFQYVDFTNKSYEDGIELAKQLLRNLQNAETSSHPQSQTVHPPSTPVDQPIKKNSQTLNLYKTIPFLIGLAGVLFIGCLAVAWVIWRPLPTPTPHPVIVTTSPPTSTFEPTLTPIPNPTITPTATSLPGPEQFMDSYFDMLVNKRDYRGGWSLLSETFKSENNPTGFDGYQSTWKKVVEWERPTWTVVYLLPTKALVSSPAIRFRGSSWYSLNNCKYCLVWDESRNTWLIEPKSACGQ